MKYLALVLFCLLSFVFLLGWIFRIPHSVEFSPLFLHQVTVSRVIDGDTIEIRGGETVRYLGVDTPEVRQFIGGEWIKRPQTGAEQASEFNRRLVGGKKVVLRFDRELRDPYQRLLAYVFADGVLVNRELIYQGWARTLFIPPNKRYYVLLRSAENEARHFGRGIWNGRRSIVMTLDKPVKSRGRWKVVQGIVREIEEKADYQILHLGGRNKPELLVYLPRRLCPVLVSRGIRPELIVGKPVWINGKIEKNLPERVNLHYSEQIWTQEAPLNN